MKKPYKQSTAKPAANSDTLREFRRREYNARSRAKYKAARK